MPRHDSRAESERQGRSVRRIESLWLIEGSKAAPDSLAWMLKRLKAWPAASPLTVFPPEAVEAAAREWLRRQGVLWEDHSVIDMEDAEAALAAALSAMIGDGDSTPKPTCSHGHTEPHTIGGKTNFHYDYAEICDEWVVVRGIATDRLKADLPGENE